MQNNFHSPLQLTQKQLQLYSDTSGPQSPTEASADIHQAPLLPEHTRSSLPNFVWGNLDGQQFAVLLGTTYTKSLTGDATAFRSPSVKQAKTLSPDCT